jgi:hypothetical protein
MIREPPTVTVQSTSGVIAEMSRLADALCHLVERDDLPPARWLSPGFVAEVARLRTRFASLMTPDELAAAAGRLGVETRTAATFEAATKKLARDATSVALATRRIELEHRVRLPSWPDILRRRRLLPLLGEPPIDTSLWFG